MKCTTNTKLRGSLLLGHTDCLSVATSRLGVLTTNANVPEVAHTAMNTDLLQALDIITKLRVQAVGNNLAVCAVSTILLSVEHPARDLVLSGVCHHLDKLLKMGLLQLTSALAKVDVSLLADEVREAATATLDGRQSIHDVLLSIDVRVKNTQDFREVSL